MRSLEKIRSMKFDALYPTHGDPVKGQDFVEHFITEYAEHRRERERAILHHLSKGENLIPEMVKEMYKDVDKRLHPAAAMSVLGHMIELVKTGRVTTPDEKPTVRSHFELVRSAA